VALRKAKDAARCPDFMKQQIHFALRIIVDWLWPALDLQAVD
jgi:hypothetical protein